MVVFPAPPFGVQKTIMCADIGLFLYDGRTIGLCDDRINISPLAKKNNNQKIAINTKSLPDDYLWQGLKKYVIGTEVGYVD